MSRNNKSELTIIMESTKQGSIDGLQTATYEKGEVYTLPTALASVFIEQQWAKIYVGKKEVKQPFDGIKYKGNETGFAFLPEGVIPREQLAEDEKNNKELIEYAEEFLKVEPGTLRHNTRHEDLLVDIINLQAKLEEELALEE